MISRIACTLSLLSLSYTHFQVVVRMLQAEERADGGADHEHAAGGKRRRTDDADEGN
jgi:hypothetical protein